MLMIDAKSMERVHIYKKNILFFIPLWGMILTGFSRNFRISILTYF